jgi:hypothetical protein
MIWRKLAMSASILSLASVASAETVTYTYDALGRLVLSSTTGGPLNGKTSSTEYDEAGNRKGHATGTAIPAGTDAAIFSVAGPASAAAEGTSAEFVITRSGPATSALTVSYATVNGSAVAPADYSSASGTLSFRFWETEKRIRIPAIDDGAGEPAEFFSMQLSAPSAGATIGTSSAAAQIAASAAANQPPVANGDQLSVGVCTDGQMNPLANDTDPEGNYPLVLVSVGTSTLGQAYVTGGNFGFSAYGTAGNQNVSYVVRDSLGNSSTGTVLVHVTRGTGCM